MKVEVYQKVDISLEDWVKNQTPLAKGTMSFNLTGNSIRFNMVRHTFNSYAGIVFTHGIWKGGPAGTGKSLSGLYLRNHKV